MKLSLLLPALLAPFALAQSIILAVPQNGATITAGSPLNVSVDRPDTLTGSEEVALIIALHSCGSNPCLPPQEVLGSILYNGPFNPQFSSTPDALPPHQNFTVTVPSGIQKGTALLSVTHFALVGAGPYPYLEFQNATVTVD